MPRRLEAWLAAGVAAAATAAALALVADRFDRGEVLPDGSSLSTAPGGSAALAAALAELPGLDVRRALTPEAIATCGAGCTLLHLETPVGVAPSIVALRRIDERLLDGARVVLAFAPVAPGAPCEICGEAGPGAPREGESGEERDRDESERGPARPLDRGRWPGWWRSLRFTIDAGGDADELRLSGFPGSARVLSRVGGEVSAVELPVGPGRLVVVADGAVLGNRSLRERRDLGRITAILGAPRRVVFEETHLGVRERGGVVVLARRYGLAGAGAALVVLALLHVWRVGSPLAPRRQEPEAAGAAAGTAASTGFVALLERTLPPGRLLATAVAAFRGTGSERLVPETWRELERIAAAGGDPVAGYERMRRAIDERRG
jgi:hypothetical protein